MRGKGQPSGTDIEIMPLTAGDEPVLWEMLRLAAHAEDHSLADVRRDPDLARYVDGWGRGGDSGVKAVNRRSGTCAGAAWLRLWSADDHGYGYIDEHTPELSIAVAPGYQAMGIGTRLLEELIASATGAHAALSLSVRQDNDPALRLYRRLGFEQLGGSDMTNRAGSTSITMRRDLPATGMKRQRPRS
jgi:ribosomal protein S18 acetylase RimI-like enzyme